MGRIKTAMVKRLSKELMKAHGKDFSPDFTKNKDVMKVVSNMPSKKIRNVVAGYVTRMKRTEPQQ